MIPRTMLGEHVAYEVQMLINTYIALEFGGFGNGLIANTMIEAFCSRAGEADKSESPSESTRPTNHRPILQGKPRIWR